MENKIRVKEIDNNYDDRICPTCWKPLAYAKLYYIQFGDKAFHIDCFENEEYQLLLLEDVLSKEEKREIENELK